MNIFILTSDMTHLASVLVLLLMTPHRPDLTSPSPMMPARSKSLPEPDVNILTYDALRIPKHSSILALGSPVLEKVIDRPRKHQSSKRVILILDVPYDAVLAFVFFLYFFRFFIATSVSTPNASLPR
ncbi:hypothetical protein FF1_028220 [Malus domestica]